MGPQNRIEQTSKQSKKTFRKWITVARRSELLEDCGKGRGGWGVEIWTILSLAALLSP
jgi:hypothetical protein